MRAARTDDNHTAIVRELRAHGFSVKSVAAVKGFVDLAVGRHGHTWLIEIKDGDKSPSRQRLTQAEQDFHDTWHGSPIVILRSVEDARTWANGGIPGESA